MCHQYRHRPGHPAERTDLQFGSWRAAGAVIGTADGVFTWTPADSDANNVRRITVRVTDDGLPPLDEAHTHVPRQRRVAPVITGIQIAGEVASAT